jgi:parallel beta helix pectate lyase-like protein
VQSRTLFVAALSLGLCACDPSVWAEPPIHEVAPPVLFVRQPEAIAAASNLVAAPLLAAPAAPVDGSAARPFPSLRMALQLAPAGALLKVEEGIWRERLLITRPVVLMGRGPGRTRIVPPEGTQVAIEVRGTDHVQLYGLSVEDAQVGIEFAGGAGHRLANVDFKNLGAAALVARHAEVAFLTGSVSDVAEGTSGHAIDINGGSLEARRIRLSNAARRAVVIEGGTAILEDLEVRGSVMGAVQALNGASVRVVRGSFEGQGGASLYAGAARLSVEGAHLAHNEYGIIVARGAELSSFGNEVTDYQVAGVALVNAHGTIQRTTISRGGTEGGISITSADGKTPILLLENSIQDPGPMGVHVTSSSVTARGNTITGARHDRDRDLGDGFYAIESRLVVEDNVMRGNAGSGITLLRSDLRADGNGFIENGRAGLLMLDRSTGTAFRNLFQRNALAAVELGEQARANLVHNRFEDNARLDIDTGCGKGLTGTAQLGADNTFSAPVRRRACAE